MSKVVDLQFNNAYYAAFPTFNGVGDTNAIRTGVAEGSTGYFPFNTGGRFNGITNQTLTGNNNRVIPLVNLLEGWLVQPNNPYIDIWFSDDPKDIGPVFNQGAIRAIISFPNPSGANTTIVQGLSTSTTRWLLSAYNGGGWGFQGVNFVSGNPGGGIYRVEIQWDTSETNWLVARLYLNDGTTLFNSSVSYLNSSPNGINAIRLGDTNGSAGGLNWGFGEIEIWNTRDGDGTFSNIWSNASGGVLNTSYSGSRRSSSYSIPTGYSLPTDSVNADYTSYVNQAYGNNSRIMDVYIPNGTPPNGETWPVIFWAHSGFFITGSKNDIVSHWLNRLINAGYAVVTVGYIRSTSTANAYSAWGTVNGEAGSLPGYGKYPSWIIDYKLAAVRMRDKYSYTGTNPLTNDLGFGINPRRMIATGYSAGGYIALGAALSRDLTDDGSGRDLSIAGNTTYRIDESGTAYTGKDPKFIGAFVYAAPISIKLAVDNDWTHNLTNAVLWPGYYPSGGPTTQGNGGVVHMTSRAFMGLPVTSGNPSGSSFTNTDITNIIAKQHAANPSYLNMPIGYVRGTADYLIHYEHEEALATATVNTEIDYHSYTSPAHHHNIDEIYSESDILDFLDSAIEPIWTPKILVF